MHKTVMTAVLAAVIGSAVTAGIFYFSSRPDTAEPPAPAQAAEAATASVPPEASQPEPPAADTPAAKPVSSQPAAKRPVRTEPIEPEAAPRPAPVVAATNKPSPFPSDTPGPRPTPPEIATPASQPVDEAEEQAFAPSAPEPPPPPAPRMATIPAGTLLRVRLLQELSSATNEPGDSFTANLDEPLIIGDLVIAEKGARLDGRVVDVARSGKVKGLAKLDVDLVSLYTSDGQRIALSTQTFEKTAEKSTREDAEKIGIGSAIGAAIGAIAGGGKGAAIGAAAGGGAGAGAVLATRGKPAELASETPLIFRTTKAVTVTEKLH